MGALEINGGLHGEPVVRRVKKRNSAGLDRAPICILVEHAAVPGPADDRENAIDIAALAADRRACPEAELARNQRAANSCANLAARSAAVGDGPFRAGINMIDI